MASPPTSPLRILLLEDDPDDVLLLQAALRQAGIEATLQTVGSRAGFEAALQSDIDLVLSDHVLPQFSAIDALRLIRERNLNVPFIIVSGLIDDETAVEAIRLGADDYVLKDRLPRLGSTIRKVLDEYRLRRTFESEREFTTSALNALPDIFFVIDERDRFRRWNRRFREVTGYSDAEMASLHPADLFVQPDRTSFLQTIRQVRADEPSVIEASIQTRDGTHVPYEFTVAVLQSSSNDRSGVCAVGRDLTQRRQAKEALKHSEEKYRSLFESASDAIFLIKDGRIVDCNARTLELLGCDRAMLIGQPPHLFSPPTQPEGRASEETFSEMMEAALASEPQRFEWIHQRYNGQPFDAEIQLSKVVTDGTVYLQALVRNITARKRYEEGLIEAKEKAEEMNRLKDAFLTNMSHEVRTPLTAILGFSELLTGLIEGEVEEFASLIYQSGQRLLDTLNQVLDLAQIEGGQLNPQLQPLPLLDTVRPVLETAHRRIEAAGLELVVTAPDEPVVVQADEATLRRVLVCLLSNAEKFTPAGRITVAVAADSGMGCLRVSDTGIGISPDFMPYLFEAFKQESTGIGRTYEGAGLGLTIARRLVEAMHGTIQVTSEPGTGSTFTVALPLAVSSQTAPLRGTSSTHEPPHLLLIEDNIETRTLFSLMLRSYAHLDVAPTSAQAIDLLQENAYDAVLLDIDLGEALSGTDLLHYMRTLPGYDAVPAVACTAYALPGDSTRFLATGFDAYLPKPFTRNDLLNTLQYCLPGHPWAQAKDEG